MQSFHAQQPSQFTPAQRRALADAYRLILQAAARAEGADREETQKEEAAANATAGGNDSTDWAGTR